MKRGPRAILAVLCGGLLSPVGWVVRAVLLLCIFAILHLLGWRDYVRIISGTSVRPDAYFDPTMLRGVCYGLAWFAAVIVAPILLIAVGLLYLLRQRWGEESGNSGSPDHSGASTSESAETGRANAPAPSQP